MAGIAQVWFRRKISGWTLLYYLHFSAEADCRNGFYLAFAAAPGPASPSTGRGEEFFRPSPASGEENSVEVYEIV